MPVIIIIVNETSYSLSVCLPLQFILKAIFSDTCLHEPEISYVKK